MLFAHMLGHVRTVAITISGGASALSESSAPRYGSCCLGLPLMSTTFARGSVTSRTLRHFGLVSCWLAACAIGCYAPFPVSPDYIRAHQSAEVDALVGARGEVAVHLKDARIIEEALVGVINSCVGPLPTPAGALGCEQIRAQGSIPIAQVQRLEVQKLRPGAVVAGVIVGTAAIAFATVLATRPAASPEPAQPNIGSSISCPHVHSFDGKNWVLDSGTYGGSLFEAAQRTDYDLLEHLAPVDGRYELTISDVADETEHTDALAIEVVDHPAGTRVVPAYDGTLLTFSAPVRPMEARDLRGADALAQVLSLDERYWRSDVSARRADVPADTQDGLELTFPRAAGATTAKLLVSGMNTTWSASLVGQFLSSLGSGIEGWYARMNADLPARTAFAQFLLREAMLRVDVWTGKAWAPRGVFWEAGPEVRKQQAMRLDLGGVIGPTVRIRLHAPVGFWSIDEVAIDYTNDVPLRAQRLQARVATTRGGRDVRAELAATDGLRYLMRKGDSARLTFDAPSLPGAGWERSFVLMTTGYYVVNVPPAPDGSPAVVDALMSTPGLLARESLTGLEWTVAREILE
jgi:hypothetical protein